MSSNGNTDHASNDAQRVATERVKVSSSNCANVCHFGFKLNICVTPEAVAAVAVVVAVWHISHVRA